MEGFYEAKIEALETELAKYKSCAVIGGDGEPIGIGDIISFYNDEFGMLTGPVQELRARDDFEVEDDMIYVIVYIPSFERDFRVEHPSDCFSTPEAAKGGGE